MELVLPKADRPPVIAYRGGNEFRCSKSQNMEDLVALISAEGIAVVLCLACNHAFKEKVNPKRWGFERMMLKGGETL